MSDATPRPARWLPETEPDVREAVDSGTLAETHYLDVKREVGATTRGRKELARDLASFAIDGGALLVGVAEDQQQTWSLHPGPLAGQAERIEQVAHAVVDPPLFVTVRLIETEDDPARGYMVVEVPPSPSPPHMVDGVYYGRGDRVRVRLTDAEVTRQHAARQSVEDLGRRLLAGEEARDHVPAEERQVGRLYLIAQPVGAPRRLALSMLGDGYHGMIGFVQAAERGLPYEVQRCEPTPQSLAQYVRRADRGALVSNAAGGAGRTLDPAFGGEEDLADLEVLEDGGLRMLLGPITWESRGVRRIDDALAAAYCRRLVHWSATMAEQTGFRGRWVLGVLAVRLRGLESAAFHGEVIGRRGAAWDREEYRQVTMAHLPELQQQPWAVAERLAGQLLRGLGTVQLHGAALRPPSGESTPDSP